MNIKLLSLILFITLCSCNVLAQTAPPADNTLTLKRRVIDSLDSQLIKLLGERESVVKEIGIYKAKNHIPALQSARFQQVLNKGIAAGKNVGLSETFITELLNAVHKESLRIEEEIK
ncbi:chorismate mutase [Mucilaginibacter sp. HMF5004]|uniref:chorismate mutase n=1 Tax=Mucilaginibacter rivuli TaxID=2857527 RepID=UPI001C6039A2|nr:chorismate mutase [Mucilaginibacter rivuli]MBW4888551.1 chorismate mutase [Mucilaginibacter rivuli]